MSTSVGDGKRERVLELLRAGWTYGRIKAKMQVSDWLITECRRELGLVGQKSKSTSTPSPASTETSQLSDPVDAERERAARQRERREHIDAVRELAFRDVVRGAITEAVNRLEPPPQYRPIVAGKNAVTESMVLNLSDWHADEIVRSENVFGLNEYDREVMDRRSARIVHATVDIKTRLESGGYRFPNLVIAANGDMVSGTIHEVERHTDGPNVMQTALRCGQVFASVVRDLSAHFERIYVFGTPGNHGRLGDARKVQTKDPTRSWDYLVYEYAAALLADCPNVQVEVPDAWAVMYELEGKLFYQGHGHFIKSWNSIPFYGINRMTSRLGAVLAKHFRPVDYWLFGHFHVHGSIENAGGEYIINPPLIGPQEFGVHSFGDAVAPGQLLFGVHPKHGITHRWRLSAEDVWPPDGKGLKTMKIRARV
jgi:hypothetical protein